MRFEDAFYENVRDFSPIARRKAPELGMTPEAVEAYLRNIRYRLGPEDCEGLAEFRSILEGDISSRP